MTQTGQATLYYWPETVPGEIPAAPPTGKRVPFISESLFAGPNKVDSPEITAGNEPEDQVTNGFEGAGDTAVAFKPKVWDDWLASLLWGTWANPAGGVTPVRSSGAANVTYVSATRTLTTATTWTNTPAVGDKILVWGSGNAYLDGIHTVESATSTDIVLKQDGKLSTSAVPNIAVGKNVTIIRGQRLTNSLTPTQQAIGFERRVARTRGTFLASTATGGAPVTDYSVYLGGMPTRLQLQGTGTQPITGTFSWELMRELTKTQAASETTVLGGTTEPYAGKIFQGINAVKKLQIYVPQMSAVAGDAGVIQDTYRLCPQSINLELGNGMISEQLMCAQPEKDFQFTEPLLNLTGTGIYDSPFARKAFDGEYDCVADLALVNDDGEGYLIHVPRGKFTVARVNAGGRRQVMSLNFTVKAFRQIAAAAAGDSDRCVEIYRFANS